MALETIQKLPVYCLVCVLQFVSLESTKWLSQTSFNFISGLGNLASFRAGLLNFVLPL